MTLSIGGAWIFSGKTQSELLLLIYRHILSTVFRKTREVFIYKLRMTMVDKIPCNSCVIALHVIFCVFKIEF